MGVVTFVAILLIAGVAVVAVVRSRERRVREQRAAELAPVRRLAYEDVTALGEQLRLLDADVAGRPLDEGARADYQRALEAYESAKQAADAVDAPDQIKDVTAIIDDAGYAIACVRARVDGRALPARRPPCFFDPRHGTATTEVDYAPPGGVQREVPACALDAERVRAGAEPDVRQVMVGTRRVPYWQGGRAYQPYAAGYFGGFAPLDWMFLGLMFGGAGDGLGDLMGGIGEGIGDGIGAIGDGVGGLFDGVGDLFDSFDL